MTTHQDSAHHTVLNAERVTDPFVMHTTNDTDATAVVITKTDMTKAALDRAEGCLLGQLSGDALGSLVEFCTPEQIRARYPDGVRLMADGGTWNTVAGQPTDDSEMALLLARQLAGQKAEQRAYDGKQALSAYQYWLDSEPFDCGMTTAQGLQGNPNPDSQANGALMRISPLGIFGSRYPLATVAQWAMQDALLTHPHPICQQVNALYAMAISHAIRSDCTADQLYELLVTWAKQLDVANEIQTVIVTAKKTRPADYVTLQGWVLIAFHNALYQLYHAKTLEDAVVDTIMQGGDTDTNAAICGALLGAVHGRSQIPEQWQHTLAHCEPNAGNPNVQHPRPKCFWPTDALALAKSLLMA